MTATDPVLEHLRATLGFQYEIGRMLGRGGMGTVYFAREVALDREVAIKVLPPIASTGDSRDRFLREARTAAKLTHPNIVPLFTFGDTGTVLYYVMGYVHGESLEARLRREGRIDPDEAQRILEELGGALVYAHEKGIVHRDIKPDNILIEEDSGRALLTDFGIAKQLTATGETLTQTGVIVGTPRYMSPEQAAGDRDIDGRTDIFSLGVVGYTMLAGRAPFEGGGVREILAQQITRGAPPLATVAHQAPSPICRAIDGALRAEPSARWKDATRFLEAIRDESNDEERTPLRFVKSGNWLLMNSVTMIAVADMAWWMAHRPEIVAFRPMWWIFAIMPVGFVVDAWGLSRSGVPWKELRRYMMQPPKRWALWWPARHRRPGDVWFRLPSAVRLMRVLRSFGFAFVFAAFESTILLLTLPGKDHDRFGMVTLGLFLASLVSLVGSVIIQLRWGHRMGFSARESDSIAARSTSDAAFWKRPHIARLLAPAQPARALRDTPTTPAELVAAIRRVAAELPPSMRQLSSDAVGAARQFSEALAALDREIAKLAEDSDPAEQKRLEDRIAAINVADAPEQAQMRELFIAQLALIRRMSERLDKVSTRRARVYELLRMLWLQLADLRGAAVRNDADSDITGRIRSVIADAARASEAYHELNPMTTNTPA
jgi:serine/threonine protein kinase